MANSWQVGTMYIQPNGPNGLFRQPGGPGTLVYPQQQTSVNYYETTPFSELTGVFSAGADTSRIIQRCSRNTTKSPASQSCS